jgi:hypothetical protein
MPGYLDVLDTYQVSGWCLEAGSNIPDRVGIYIDNREVAQIPCNLPRPDLQNVGLGSGYGGFRYVFAEPIGLRHQNVVVRALSSGDILPHVGGTEVESAGTIISGRRSLFDDASFFKPIYAVELSAPTLIDGALSVGVRQGVERRVFTVTASALAPADAVLGFVPAGNLDDITVGPLESSDAPLAGLPDGAPNFRNLRFEIAVSAPFEKHYIALNLVELNQTLPEYGRNPVNTIA